MMTNQDETIGLVATYSLAKKADLPGGQALAIGIAGSKMFTMFGPMAFVLVKKIVDDRKPTRKPIRPDSAVIVLERDGKEDSVTSASVAPKPRTAAAKQKRRSTTAKKES